MKLRATSLLLVLASCFTAPSDELDGSIMLDGGSADGGAPDGGAPSNRRCVQISGSNETVCVTLTPVVCGGRACGAGEVCCQTTGACVLPGPSTCPKPATTTTPNATPCASSADCASDEYCIPDDYRAPSGGRAELRCISGSGHCQNLAFCGSCGGPPDRCQVCGCNGVTYASPQEACVAGVWSANGGACGVPSSQLPGDGGAYTIPCGNDSQCPAGAQCCFRTGKCFDTSEPWRCEVQPNGSVLNCASHAECNPGSGAGGGSGSSSGSRLCVGSGCAGPGICESRGSTGSCGGEVQQVCGCDGVTYVNECWARAGGTRVASAGPCP